MASYRPASFRAFKPRPVERPEREDPTLTRLRPSPRVRPSALPALAALAALLAPACSREPTGAPEALVAPGPSLQANGSSYYPPPEAAGGWRKSTDPAFIRSLGVDPVKLNDFMNYCLSSWPESGCLVIKDGWLIAEGYRQPEGAQHLYQVRSNSKAYTMAAFGHLLGERSDVNGTPFNLDSRLYDPAWLPEGFPLSDPNKSKIIFRHIFFHITGIVPEATGFKEAKQVWGHGPAYDFVPYTLGKDPDFPSSKELYFPPGRFRKNDGGYSSVAFNHLTLVIQNITGIPAKDYLRREILDAIGAGRVDLRLVEGYWPTAHGVFTTARDYGRFAYLLLRGGNWAGQQIVPRSFLETFTSTDKSWNLRGNVNGFYDTINMKFPSDMFAIEGSQMNWAFITPSKDLIGIRLGRGDNEQYIPFEEGFLERLFAAVGEAPPPPAALSNGDFVTAVYHNLLGRDPDPGGFDFWSRQLAGGFPRHRVVATFLGSNEYQQGNAAGRIPARFGPLSDDQYLWMLYRDVLGRNPDPAGYDYWKRQLAGGFPRHRVAAAFVGSGEYQARS